jgi:two-component system, cell cycle sensor histidine kinase and response regulator CckA
MSPLSSAAPGGRFERRLVPHPLQHVLLVEDDDDLRGILVQGIRGEGYGVLDIADGATASRILDEDAYDQGDGAISALVTDLRMPGFSGVELALSLRQRHCHLPVVLISGFTDGLDDLATTHRFVVLPKPFTMQQLLDAMEAAEQRVTVDLRCAK